MAVQTTKTTTKTTKPRTATLKKVKPSSVLPQSTILDMSKVAEEIIKMPVDKTDTIEDLFNKFFKIMKKYGIKQGTKTKFGFTKNRLEWTLCETMFTENIQHKIKVLRILDDISTPRSIES